MCLKLVFKQMCQGYKKVDINRKGRRKNISAVSVAAHAFWLISAKMLRNEGTELEANQGESGWE